MSEKVPTWDEYLQQHGAKPPSAQPLRCPVCGSTFYRPPTVPTKRYCSERCKQTAQNRRARARFEPKPCVVCGREFTPTHPNQVACPGPCRVLRRRLSSSGRHYSLGAAGAQLIREQVEQEKLYAEQRKLYEALRSWSAMEVIAEVVRSNLGAIPTHRALPSLPKPSRRKPEQVVLLISDCHIGLEVRPQEVGGLGGYSLEVFLRRLKLLKQEVVDAVSRLCGRQPQAVHVWFLGDLVEGTQVYRGQPHYLEQTVVEQVFTAADELSVFIAQLQDLSPRVSVAGVIGNHGRIGRKHSEKSYVNWDWVAYQVIARLLERQPHVTTYFPPTFWLEREVLGHRFLLLRGSNVRGWSSVPWRSIQQALNDFQEVLLDQDPERSFDYACLAHHHTQAEIQAIHGERLINGSWTGATQYSLERLFAGHRPRQLIFGVNQDGVTWRYWLHLDRKERR